MKEFSHDWNRSYSKNPRDILVSTFFKTTFRYYKKVYLFIILLFDYFGNEIIVKLWQWNFGNEIIVEVKGIYQPQK